MNTAYLLLGSNILPEENTLKAIASLNTKLRIANMSSIWETHAIGNEGPNFLNCVLFIETEHSFDELKSLVIKAVEDNLRRVRTDDKYAPRTIDIDLLIFNDQQIDQEICHRVFIAVPLAELKPDFFCAENNVSIKEVAEKLRKKAFIQKWKTKKTVQNE